MGLFECKRLESGAHKMVVLKDGFGRKGHIDNGYVSINDEEDEDLTELKEAGLDPEELKFMDDDDR